MKLDEEQREINRLAFWPKGTKVRREENGYARLACTISHIYVTSRDKLSETDSLSIIDDTGGAVTGYSSNFFSLVSLPETVINNYQIY